MRATHITIFLMMFYMSISLLQSINLFTTTTLITPKVAEDINTTYQNLNTTVETVGSGTDVFGFLTFWHYLKIFWNTFFTFIKYALFLAPMLINEFQVPITIAWTLQLIIYIIYVITFFEIITSKTIF